MLTFIFSLVGLPPSWSASLIEAGYSDAEIAAINARRAASRSPTSQYGYTERPRSPATGNTVMLHPAPRTTSLSRLSPSPIPSLPFGQSVLSMAHVRKISIESSRQACESPSSVIEISKDADAQYIEISSNLPTAHTNQSSISSYHSSHFSRSRNSSVASSAANSSHGSVSSKPKVKSPSMTGNTWAFPPKRPFHVANGSPSPVVPSTPPTYNFLQYSFANGKTNTEKNKSLSSASSVRSTVSNGRHPETNHEKQETDVFSSEAGRSPPTARKPLSQRLAALPPRLSLSGHNDDISTWSEALLSAIPAVVHVSDSSSSSASPPSQFAAAQSAHVPPPLSLASKSSTPPSGAYPSPPDSQAETARPITAIKRSLSVKSAKSAKLVSPVVVKDYDEDDTSSTVLTATRSPLWDEIMGMVQQDSPGLYQPAVNEMNSPIIPFTPGSIVARPFRDGSFIQMDADEAVGKRDRDGVEDDDDEDDSLEDLERDPNRDSNTSTASVSTVSTVTVATVVRQASLAKRAVANVIRPLRTGGRGGEVSPRDMQMVEEEDETAPLSAVDSLKSPDMAFSGSSIMTGRSSWSSPQNSPFSSEMGSGSSTSGAPPEEEEGEEGMFPEEDGSQAPKTPAYLSFFEPSPIPSKTNFGMDSTRTLRTRPETFGVVLSEDDLTSPQRLMLVANGELPLSARYATEY